MHLKKRIRSGDVNWLMSNVWKFATIPISRAIKHPLSGPIIGGIFLLYGCNYRCLYCDYPERKHPGKTRLTLEDFYRVIDDYHELGLNGVGFMGGEPLLYRGLHELIRHAKSKNMTAAITTNGSMTTNEENAEKLLSTGIDMVGISIDGPNAEINDKIRGVPGSFNNSVLSVKSLINARNKLGSSATFTVNTVLNRQNIEYVNEMPDFAKSLGADSINIMGVETLAIETDSAEKKDMIQIEKEKAEKIDRIVDALIERKKKDNMIDNSFAHLRLIRHQFRGEKLPIKCYAGNTSLYVDCYGDVFPCNAFLELKRPVANISGGKSLVSIWKSREYQGVRDKISTCRDCYFGCQNEFNAMLSVKAKFLR